MTTSMPTDSASSPWAPMRYATFRWLWVATLVSNIGTWLQDTAASWHMTTLTALPLWVSLVQAAGMAPLFFLALPGGVFADIADRRRLLLIGQGWCTLAAAMLGLLTLRGYVTPPVLLGLVACVACGSALSMPAWRAIVPDLVPKDLLRAAISLNGISMNIARAIGPAAAGLIVARGGTAAAYLLNAASFLAIVFVLWRWENVRPASRLPAEGFGSAMASAIRYARHAPRLRAILVRTVLILSGASAAWGMLPLLVRFRLNLDASHFGMALGAAGLGALASVWTTPFLVARLDVEDRVSLAVAIYGFAMAGIALAPNFPLLAAGMAVIGGAWMIIMTQLSMCAQILLPDWIRGRGLALHTAALAISLMLGSATWGMVATWTEPQVALGLATVWLFAGGLARFRYPLREVSPALLQRAADVPIHALPTEAGFLDRGPVLVTIEYTVDPARLVEFYQVMERVRRSRLREGAFAWHLSECLEQPEVYVENFSIRTWVEHLRQHERITQSDREAQERARTFHIGAEPPRIRHYIGLRR